MRLESLSPDQLSAEQATLYEKIAKGPRAQGKQAFPLTEATGALTGPFGIMLHLPALGTPLQELGAAIRYRTELSNRVREIAILCVAEATNSEFERYAHERLGRLVGLSDEELTKLSKRQFHSKDSIESTAYDFCQRLVADNFPLPVLEYEAISRVLGKNAMIEITTLVGYYRTLAQLLHVFDVGLPEAGSDDPEV